MLYNVYNSLPFADCRSDGSCGAPQYTQNIQIITVLFSSVFIRTSGGDDSVCPFYCRRGVFDGRTERI